MYWLLAEVVEELELAVEMTDCRFLFCVAVSVGVPLDPNLKEYGYLTSSGSIN